jgi:signal transduction histidine kinase
VSGAAGGRWSIAERTTRWFAIHTALIALVLAVAAIAYVRRTVHRDLEGLVREQLDEISLAFQRQPGAGFGARRDEFESLVESLRVRHRHNPTAFRVWDATTGAPLGDFGEEELLAAAPPSQGELDVTRRRGELWSRTTRLEGDCLLGITVDGESQAASLERFYWLCAILAAIAGITTFFLGAWLIRRSMGFLRQVAARTREVRAARDGRELALEHAPDEIREIVDALSAMLRNIRAEQDRTRLLTAGLAHELGSPLQNLIGETEVALMGPVDVAGGAPAEAAEYKRVLKSHLEELRDIGHAVGNLMTLVSIDQDARERETEVFDFGEEAAVRLRRERAHGERRGVALEASAEGDLAIHGDREALWLVVSNLVANAIDYTPHGGRVRLEIRGDAERVRIVVDDTGPGVPPDQREKIFEAFYRGPTAKGRRAGYGLGLSIVKKAVDAHGGTLLVEDSPLGGARFRVELPRAARRLLEDQRALPST